ncbi:MAG: Bug family tripartite tricarboxylate transporter substrate binding protein [Burkholderiaceae bacterium]
MQDRRRVFVVGAAAASLSLIGSRPARAQAAESFPVRPIRLLVGFPAGGALDLTARAIAQKWSERLGQPIIVENRPGATGTIATAALAKSPPDGHVLLFVSSAHAANPAMYKSLPYDTLTDFAAVGLGAVATPVLTVTSSLKVDTVPQLIALAKSKPGVLNFYSSGVGSASHVSATLFASAAGIDVKHVPYKGTADGVRDLVSGEVHFAIDSATALMPFIRDGRLKALAVGTRTRSTLLPDTPTLDEAGLKGFSVFSWGGFLAPAKTPRAVILKLNTELNAVLQMPEVREQLDRIGTPALGGSADEFDQLIRTEIARFAKVIAAAGGPQQ